jgi:hypothetical protein
MKKNYLYTAAAAIRVPKKIKNMRRHEHAVWLIATPLGDALRANDDIDEVVVVVAAARGGGDTTTTTTTQLVRLKKPCLAIEPNEFPRSDMRCMMFSKEDLPDLTRTQSKVCNVCGFVVGPCKLLASHAAWKTARSALGHFSEAYTLRAGNLLFMHDKLIFKGATDYVGVFDTIRQLTISPETLVLKAYLVVLSGYLQKNLYVHQCCLLEEMLSRVHWCRVMQRHDEMSNAVLFYINDWKYLLLQEGRGLLPPPDMCMVSVSRRGVINVRLGWHGGAEWVGNDVWIALVDKVRDFINTLC